MKGTSDVHGNGVGEPVPVKAGLRIAAEIERTVLEGGLRPGVALGTEDDLVRRFGTSRWVVRQGMAIAEIDGLIQRVRGRRGGFFVARPSESVIMKNLRNFMLFADFSVEAILEARSILDRLILTRAAVGAQRNPQLARAAEAAAALTSATLEQRIRRNDLLIAMADSPALGLFARTVYNLLAAKGICLNVSGLADDALTPIWHRQAEIRRTQILHVIDGDAAAALSLQAELDCNHRRAFREDASKGPVADIREQVRRLASLADLGLGAKQADIIAVMIQLDALRSGSRVGEPIGSERDLMNRYRVSRWVLREALASLERDGFIRPAEGGSGGLYVGRPDPAGLIRRSVFYLVFMKMSLESLIEAGASLEAAAVRLACQRVAHGDALSIAQLRAALHAASETFDGHALKALAHAIVASAGNPVIILFYDLLSAIVIAEPAVLADAWPEHPVEYLVHMQNLVGAMERGEESNALESLENCKVLGRQFSPRFRALGEISTAG